MSKYNRYAEKLDLAFKDARKRCLDALKDLHETERIYELAQRGTKDEAYVGSREANIQRAAANLKDAQHKYLYEFKSAWESFMNARDDLTANLIKELREDYKIDVKDIDRDVVAIIQTGICTPSDLMDLSGKFRGNSTMLRYIADAANRAQGKEGISREEYNAYSKVAKDCDPMHNLNDVRSKWETIINAADKFSGRRNPDGHDYVESMLSHWEDVAPNINNF